MKHFAFREKCVTYFLRMQGSVAHATLLSIVTRALLALQFAVKGNRLCGGQEDILSLYSIITQCDGIYTLYFTIALFLKE
ncbi:hypothetical protein QBC46DRAFT_397590 [Diplogelasinospora grovesii]|uniref:Uncharacterized protein n=1 Tax=Diplogelasinospora grovesii TaxID=303347 RepID=A0AAN6MYF4_9PEZI|nr:hypothetical protein QBC46DRAFT_397590 [Diplogelasinospora grovesii]